MRHRSGVNNRHELALCDPLATAGEEEAGRRNERLTIDLLFGGIAHEINNAIASALLAAETALTIKDLPDSGEQLTACLRNIVASADRCGRSVRSLLRYSRDEPAEKWSCRINEVLEHALDLTRFYAERQGVAVRLDCDADIPAVPMNPLEIELMLVNLIRNAVEASRGGAEILVRTAPVEGGICVSVSPCPKTTPSSNIMQDIVRRHGGSLQRLSRRGEGMIATVVLPTGVDPSFVEDRSQAGEKWQKS